MDGLTSATPLESLEQGGELAYSYQQLLVGIRPGCLGETCIIALLLGGLYLVVRRVISPLIPAVFVGTVFILTWLLGENPLVHILSGGLMLGAVFMATDYATSPINPAGKAVFAAGCGLLTVLIRVYGSLPEGVSFAIVIMNVLVPLIERATRPPSFRRGKEAPKMVKKVMDRIKNSGVNLKEVAVSALTLAVIAGAMTAALALTNAVTKDRIEKINRQAQSDLRKQVIDADTFEEKRFTENGEEVSYYAAKKGNQPVGFVFTVSSTGKSSGLVVMTGISTEGKVTGVVVVEDNETAGFVDMVRKGGLLDRIAGWSSDLKLKLGENIDGVSQATKTAKGITDGVNTAMDYFNTHVKGEVG